MRQAQFIVVYRYPAPPGEKQEYRYEVDKEAEAETLLKQAGWVYRTFGQRWAFDANIRAKTRHTKGAWRKGHLRARIERVSCLPQEKIPQQGKPETWPKFRE